MRSADVAWKFGGSWYLLTERTPSQMGAEPVAVYFPNDGKRAIRRQYRLNGRPHGGDLKIVQVSSFLNARFD